MTKDKGDALEKRQGNTEVDTLYRDESRIWMQN